MGSIIELRDINSKATGDKGKCYKKEYTRSSCVSSLVRARHSFVELPAHVKDAVYLETTKNDDIVEAEIRLTALSLGQRRYVYVGAINPESAKSLETLSRGSLYCPMPPCYPTSALLP